MSKEKQIWKREERRQEESERERDGGKREGKGGKEKVDEREGWKREVGEPVGADPIYTQYWLCFSAGLVCRQSLAMSGSRFTHASQGAHFSTGSVPGEAI